MRSLNGTAVSALSGPSVGLATLLRMDLTVPVFFNTTAWDLTWSSNLYSATGVLMNISPIDDSPGEVKGARITISGVPSSLIAVALAEPVQGKPVTIYTGIFNPSTYQIADAAIEWAGRLDVFSIVEEGTTCTIGVTAEHVGIDLLRPSSTRYTNTDQQRLFAGDLGLQYVVDQSDQQIVWPSREYYKQ